MSGAVKSRHKRQLVVADATAALIFGFVLLRAERSGREDVGIGGGEEPFEGGGVG